MSPALDAVTAYENSAKNPLNENIKRPHDAPADSLPVYQCIRKLSELSVHIKNTEKFAKYDLLLSEMGMNVDFFKGLREKPSLIYVSQPGPWFSINHQIIISLLQKLAGYFDCNEDLSGIFALNNDRFTFGGLKKTFNNLNLANDLKPVHFVENKFIEANEGLAYPYVSIKNADSKILRSTFEISRNIIKSSQKSFKEFEHEIRTMPHEVIDRLRRIDDFIPHGCDLKKLYDLLHLIYREKILDDLDFAIDSVKNKVAWHQYWNGLNKKILNVKIKSADKILNKYILAIENVHKLANWIITNTAPAGDPAILNLIDPFSHEHFCVFYDTQKAAAKVENFLYYNSKEGDSAKQYLSWEEIINLAEQELTSGPTYIVKYLLRAASHFYFMVDYDISTKNTKHDDIINRLHQEKIGIAYPWISVSPPINNDTSEIVPDNSSMIALYSPFHEIEQSTAIARFFAG
jgi:hypothetical protein